MLLTKFTPYIWMAAFLCSLFFINDWQLELFGAAIILIGVWAVSTLGCAVNGVGLHVPQSWCLRLMGAFWLLVFLSVIGSNIINVSLMAFCFFGVMPLGFLIFSITGTRQQYEMIAKILMIVFAGLAIWALIQFFFLNEYFRGRASHPLRNPNSLAALFSLAFFCGLGAVMAARDRWQKMGAVAFITLIFAGIMATGSRGALFAMVPFIGMFLFFMRGEVVKNGRLFLSVFLLCAGAFLLSYFGETERENLLVRVVEMAGTSASEISNNRFALWSATFDIIKEHGLWGTGIGTYFLYFPEFRLPTDGYGAYYAHSDPLQYWVELGVLGPVLFYSFIIAVTGRTIQAVRKTSDVSQRLMILAPFFALATCIAHTHITFNLYNLSILFAVGLLLTVWFYATQQVLKTVTKEVKFPASFTASSRLVAIALPFLFIGVIFTAYITSEHYTNKARDHLLEADLENFAEDVLMANKISMRGNYRSYLLAVNVPLTILEEAGNNLTRDQKKEVFDQALNYLKHVLYINPRSASAHYYLAKVQQLVPEDFISEELRKSLKSPQEYYERSIELDPIHVGSRIELSHIYERDLLSFDRALALVEQGVTYRYSTAKAMDLYGRLLQLYLKNGNQEGRIRMIEKMKSFSAHLDKSRAKQEQGFGFDFGE